MKIKLLLAILAVSLVTVSCFSVDKPPVLSGEKEETIDLHDLSYDIPKNVTINGEDYLQSQLPIGKFGGEFGTSTSGEGPKTFNLWTAKDNTSTEICSTDF